LNNTVHVQTSECMKGLN